MAKYTTELRTIIDSGFDIGLDSYPIFDENYRSTLNQKIKDHYNFYEIGFETAERFKFELNRKMNEIMLYYNKLYKSEIDINPLINFKKVVNSTSSMEDTENESLNTTGSRNDTVESVNQASKNMDSSSDGSQSLNNTSVSSGSQDVKDVKSDTPSGQLLAGDISNDLYASEISVSENGTTGNQSTDQQTTENQTQTQNEFESGSQNQNTVSDLTSDTTKDNTKTSNKTDYINEEGTTISESELLVRYRETFLNIDLEIINELKTMFMVII